uniref:DUF4216 domain-containing protein n=1 Tax=Lactuca sativa TaxID=4236 RepID=A0A9R1WVM0_LACSA|nr:hypothetical protein LSAT_V11C800443290 [Lactuca sativa]
MAYVVDEAVTFLSRYVDDIETRFNHDERNWDVPITQHGLEVFTNKVRTLGASKFGQIGEYVDVAQWYIINNCGNELDHKESLYSRNIQQENIDTIQKNEFPYWFKKKMALLTANGDPKATDDLYALSQFPNDRYTSWQSCIVNGFRFRCKERDDKFKTQCSGMCVGDENDELIYYGVLLEVLELDFILGRNVFVFRCKWYNTDPKEKKMVVDHNLASIDITSKFWMVVQRVNHRNIYDIQEHVKDEVLMNDIFQEEESNELPPFQPSKELSNTSFIDRNDVEPETLPLEAVLAVGNRNVIADNLDDDVAKSVMSKRGGRGKRGGLAREDG